MSRERDRIGVVVRRVWSVVKWVWVRPQFQKLSRDYEMFSVCYVMMMH